MKRKDKLQLPGLSSDVDSGKTLKEIRNDGGLGQLADLVHIHTKRSFCSMIMHRKYESHISRNFQRCSLPLYKFTLVLFM